MNLRRWRSFIAGLLVSLLLGAGLMIWVLSSTETGYGTPNIFVRAIGSDVTRHGGVAVDIDGLNVICREACDDIYYVADAPEGSWFVRALDANGRELARGGGYVTTGLQQRFTLSVAEKLEATERSTFEDWLKP